MYSLSLTQIVDADDGKPGFIASANTDRFGRLVSYLFPKSAKLTDGAAMAEEVTARNITDVRVLFAPGKRFEQALDTVEFQKESAS